MIAVVGVCGSAVSPNVIIPRVIIHRVDLFLIGGYKRSVDFDGVACVAKVCQVGFCLEISNMIYSFGKLGFKPEQTLLACAQNAMQES